MKLFVVYCNYEDGVPCAIAMDKTKAENFAEQREAETEYNYWVEKIEIKESSPIVVI